MHLGDFGVALRELDPDQEKATFGFFDQKFEIVAELPPMLVFQLAASMTGKIAETEGMAAVWEALRISLGDESFNRLYKLAVDKRADMQSLMELVMALFQASGGERPTEQVPVSPVGLSPTSPSSSTSASTPPAFGGDPEDRSVPRLVPVSQVLAG